MRTSIFAVIGGAAAFLVGCERLPVASVTVEVADVDGRPFKGAHVAIGFEQPVYRPGRWGSAPVVAKTGRTNDQGLFSAEATSSQSVTFTAKSGNHYTSHGTANFVSTQDRRWQPWDPIKTVVLKPRLTPIAMFATRFNSSLPALDQDCYLDLTRRAWVNDDSEAKSGDLVFKVVKDVKSFADFQAELVLRFRNPGDGIQAMPVDLSGSALRSAHEAPESGYQSALSLRQGNTPGRGSHGLDDKTGYYFRVRTVLDENGKVVSAHYGKIYGGIQYSTVSEETASLLLTYYFNPTPNDRNVEYDPEKNLFTDLRRIERPSAP